MSEQAYGNELHRLGRADALRDKPFGHALSVNGGRPYAVRTDWQRWCYWWGWTLERTRQEVCGRERRAR